MMDFYKQEMIIKNIQGHTCEENRYGLKWQNTLWKDSYKHGKRKITHNGQSTGIIKGKNVAGVDLYST